MPYSESLPFSAACVDPKDVPSHLTDFHGYEKQADNNACTPNTVKHRGRCEALRLTLLPWPPGTWICPVLKGPGPAQRGPGQ